MKKKYSKLCTRLSGLFLAAALMFSQVQPAVAATARATTMRLEKTTGTVTVKNLNGTTCKKSNGMRLYNGYQVTTGKSSEAYISLDSTKAVKLSESAQAALNQNGKKLELMVKKGKLFFNVSKALTSKESMNIRTSTMVTGVRGTCGVLESEKDTSTLYLLEGTVAYTVTDPKTGEKQEYQVKGGEKMTMAASSSGSVQPQISNLSVSEIPVFAMKEVVNDADLQQKINDTTDLNSQEIVDYYEENVKPNEDEDDEDEGDEDEAEEPDEEEDPDESDEEVSDDEEDGEDSDVSFLEDSTYDSTDEEDTTEAEEDSSDISSVVGFGKLRLWQPIWHFFR